jgi:D-alanyl-D-alanine carboxypeptidase/D-alanyl-D-alanine-endopeptidase (penicillin-binding protein 4)
MLRKALTLSIAALAAVGFAQPVSAAPSCSYGGLTRSYELGDLYGRVVDATTGKQLVAIRANEQTPSASVMKVLTGISALMELPQGFTVDTTVSTIVGADDTLVLKGAGDPTLSRLMPPHYTTYPRPARIGRLASETLAALPHGTKIKTILVDESYFNGADYNPFWKQSDRTNGYVSPITALEVDGARRNPDLTDKAYSSYRVSDPVNQAAQVFKQYLGNAAKGANISVIHFNYLPTQQIAAVTSSPVEVWVDHAMKYSDNTEVEYIARQVAKYERLGTNYTDIQPMVLRTLADLGVNPTGLVMHDAAGLAQADRVTARLITDALLATLNPQSPAVNFSRYLATTTSAGTLSTRFKGVNALPDGVVQAKTGFIPGLYSLAGFVTSKDGHRLVFAFFARGSHVGYGTRTALDSLVVKAYTCGAKLTP